MKHIVILLILSFSTLALGQQSITDGSLLEHLAGDWVLSGTIGGVKTTHDITAEWVLQHQYIQLHEISREKDSTGHPAYEAIVYLGWEKKSQEYGCFWMDITGAGAFSEQGIGRGKSDGNKIPFLFKGAPGNDFHNTFVYDATADSWQMLMDGEDKGTLQPFARVTLTRKK